MAEYSRLAQGSFTSSGAAEIINLPFQPDCIEIWNNTSADTPTNAEVPYAFWMAAMGQDTAQINVFNATPVLTTNLLSSGGFSTFSKGLSFSYGASQQVVGITKNNGAPVVEVTSHGYSTGDIVVFNGLYQTSTTGMPQITGIEFVITVTGANTFTIPWNTDQGNYTTLSGSPTGAGVRKVNNPFLYAPGRSIISALTLASTTTVDTTAPHNFVVGQEVAFRIPAGWGTTELNSLPNETIPGSPIYGYVTSVTDANTVVVDIDSSSYTAYNSNQVASPISGMQLPQIVAVGDVNTGGVAISAGSKLYPPPVVNGSNTINGPAIQGAFVNNTAQGFIVGVSIAGSSNDVIMWRASLADMVI